MSLWDGYPRSTVWDCVCVCVFQCVYVCMCVSACWAVYPPSWVLCWEGHGPFLLCAGVMVGPLHLHTFACCQTELLLTASRADCLPGPRPNPVGMVTRDGQNVARQARGQTDVSRREPLRDVFGWTDVNSNDLQMSLSEAREARMYLQCVGTQQCGHKFDPFPTETKQGTKSQFGGF